MRTPPAPERRPYVHREHGIEREDPYHWLRERDDPAVRTHLEAENAYQEAELAHLSELRKTLFDEILGRIQETDSSAPVPRGPWAYYRRTVEGKPYGIFCRRPTAGGEEQVLLDVNALTDDPEAFLEVGAFAVSPDHRRVAYLLDRSGSERYVLTLLDLEEGTERTNVLEGLSANLTWYADSRTLLYVLLDEKMRPFEARRLDVVDGTDVHVRTEDDDRFVLYARRSRTDAFVFLTSSNAVSTEVHLADAAAPDAPLRCFQPRQSGLRYFLEDAGDHFVVRTNDCDDERGEHTDGAVDYKLATAPHAATSKAEWDELLPPRPGIALTDVDVFARHIVRTERTGGRVRLIVGDRGTGAEHEIEMPEDTYVVEVAANPVYDTGQVRIRYASLVTPSTVWSYDLDARTRTTLKVQPVPGYAADRYRCARLWVEADDGARIPVSVVWRADLDPRSGLPMLLYGYGSYGITVDPDFSVARPSLLDRGVAMAIAHVRGGGMMGRSWYEAAKYHTKARTFTDFAAVGRHLIAEGWTTPERLVLQGGSAGGLLVGAVLNLAPGLCRAAVAQVPFVDALTTMLDASLPLTAGEWDEWGDPRERAYFDTIRAYAPYENVREGPYPDLLVTSGVNDPRVQYWEPTKWVARLRDRATAGRFLLKTNMGAGHQGKTGRYGRLEDVAYVYAFVLDALGLASS